MSPPFPTCYCRFLPLCKILLFVDNILFIISQPFFNPEDQKIDPSYQPVTIQVGLYDEDAISVITTYNKLYPDQNPLSETESVHITETLRRSSESGSLVPLTLPLHLPEALSEQLGERRIHDISHNSTCSSQPYIDLIDCSGNLFSGVSSHGKAFRISSSSYDSGHPVRGVETIPEEDAPTSNLAANSPTAFGGKQDDTDEGIGRNSTASSHASASSSHEQHIATVAPPQPEVMRVDGIVTSQTMAEEDAPQSGAETNFAKTDTHVFLKDNASRSETPSAVCGCELQQADPSVPHHNTSLNPASMNSLGPEHNPLNMPLTADPELARFMPLSDSGFGGDTASSHVYFE